MENSTVHDHKPKKNKEIPEATIAKLIIVIEIAEATIAKLIIVISRD